MCIYIYILESKLCKQVNEKKFRVEVILHFNLFDH